MLCTADRAKEFSVHKHLIVASSSVTLKKARSDPKTVHDKRIVLPETKTETIEGYINWLYTSDLIPSGDAEDFEYIELMELYIFGEQLEDLNFCLCVANDIVAHSYRSSSIRGPKIIRWAWQHAGLASALHSIIKELWLAQPTSKAIDMLRAAGKGYSQAFILDLFQTLVERQELQDTSFSGKSRAEIEQTCKFLVEDSDLGAEEEDE